MTLLKFFHVFCIFLWVGSLLTLSRAIASQREKSQELNRILKKIYYAIDLPAMCLAIITGLILLFLKEDVNFKEPWLHMKLTFVAILIICDHLVGRGVKKERFGTKWLKVLHYTALVSFIFILVAIYILK